MQQKVAECGTRDGRAVFGDLLGEYAVTRALPNRKDIPNGQVLW
jgi:hypothetical protein